MQLSFEIFRFRSIVVTSSESPILFGCPSIRGSWVTVDVIGGTVDGRGGRGNVTAIAGGDSDGIFWLKIGKIGGKSMKNEKNHEKTRQRHPRFTKNGNFR